MAETEYTVESDIINHPGVWKGTDPAGFTIEQIFQILIIMYDNDNLWNTFFRWITLIEVEFVFLMTFLKE